jgi:hypothetical protein
MWKNSSFTLRTDFSWQYFSPVSLPVRLPHCHQIHLYKKENWLFCFKAPLWASWENVKITCKSFPILWNTLLFPFSFFSDNSISWTSDLTLFHNLWILFKDFEIFEFEMFFNFKNFEIWIQNSKKNFNWNLKDFEFQNLWTDFCLYCSLYFLIQQIINYLWKPFSKSFYGSYSRPN